MTKVGSDLFVVKSISYLKDNPAGSMYRICIFVQIHPLFVTDSDRSYCAQCVYMEANVVEDLEQNITIRFPFFHLIYGVTLLTTKTLFLVKWCRMSCSRSLTRQKVRIVHTVFEKELPTALRCTRLSLAIPYSTFGNAIVARNFN